MKMTEAAVPNALRNLEERYTDERTRRNPSSRKGERLSVIHAIGGIQFPQSDGRPSEHLYHTSAKYL